MDKNQENLKNESDTKYNKHKNNNSSGGVGGAVAAANNSSTKNTNNSYNKKNITKRATSKISREKNHIYINNKSNLKAQLKHCEDLLNSGLNEIYIHALGNTISKCANLALILVNNSNNALIYEANTSTIENFDDLNPMNDYDDFTINRRLNSCLHIKISTNIKI